MGQGAIRDAWVATVRLGVCAAISMIATPLIDHACARELSAVATAIPDAATTNAVQIVLPMQVSALPDPRRQFEDRPVRAHVAVDPFTFFDPVRRGLHSRGSGIFDLYRRGHSGFRVSVGTRYYARYSLANDRAGGASGTAALMRLPRGAVNLRDGYEWYAPVAMAGYDLFVTNRLKLGVEGGMIFGRANGIYGTTRLPDSIAASRNASNPVADMIMTYRF